MADPSPPSPGPETEAFLPGPPAPAPEETLDHHAGGVEPPRPDGPAPLPRVPGYEVEGAAVSEPLKPPLGRRVDEACDRFDAAWQAGGRPRIADHLGDAAGAERAALLRELVLVDASYRRRAGETPRPDDYR